jgi:predicted ATP-grasp superfamily ATP-dependent carboligase
MRILVFEFITGGGLAGRPVPRSLAREGLAMRTALVEDLAAIGCHGVVVTTDLRFARAAPRSVEVVSGEIDALVDGCDAVWLVAPETNRCLERLTARIERSGKILLGPCASAVRRAADKSRLPGRLARIGIRHPETAVLSAGVSARTAAARIGYPVVIKPARGAGCSGVRLARHARDVALAMDHAHRADGSMPGRGSTGEGGPLVMQQYVRGAAVSVSLVANGQRAVPLAVNAQRVTAAAGFSYRGGSTPCDHPQAAVAAEVASRTCAAFPGLRGYVGVDLVLTEAGPVVIEVNPRLTMAYVGMRAVFEENIASLALAACDGRLPARPVARGRARFSASGRVTWSS